MAKPIAKKALPDFAKDEMLDGDRRYFAAIVKDDEARQEILRVTLSLAEEGLS